MSSVDDSGSTSALSNELRATDDDVVRERLAHVVHDQGGDTGACQRLHLDSCLMGDGDTALYHKLAIVVLRSNLNLTRLERQSVTERNQVTGLLDGHGACDDGGREHRTFLRRKLSIVSDCVGDNDRQIYNRTSQSCSFAHCLGADIDHLRLIRSLIDMRQKSIRCLG